MSSGAGDADARRRRDLPYLFNFHYLFLSFWFLLSFCICVHLSKNPNFPSLLTFFSPKPEQYSIDISHGSRSELTTVPPTAPPHWFSLMARVNLGPSDAPFPVGTSTAHGEIQIWQVALLVASSPSITTSELQSDGGGETSSAASFLGFCWMGFTSNYGPITFLWPMHEKSFEAHTLSILQALYTFADPSPALPKSRSALLNASLSRPLKICCSLKDGRRLHSTVATVDLDGTCNFNYLNLMDRVTWLPPDAILISKLFGLRLLSNHWWCDIDHASALVCEHRSSINILNNKLSHPGPKLHAFSPISHCAIHLPEPFTAASGSLWMNLRPVFGLLASHGFLPNFQTPRSFLSILLLPIRHCLGSLVDLDVQRLHLRLRLPRMFGIYIGCARILVNACLNPLLVPSVPTCQLLPQGRRFGSDLNSQGQPDYKLCVEFLNLHGQWLHVREDPPALLRLVTLQMRFPVLSSPKATSPLQPCKPLVSSVEHTFKSSNAYIVRAKYDHLLVREFLKLVFKFESHKTSKDLPSLASSSRLCIFLEDSWSLYLFISCNLLLLSCKNIPLLRF